MSNNSKQSGAEIKVFASPDRPPAEADRGTNQIVLRRPAPARRKRAKHLAKATFALVVLLPTLLVAAYMYFVASDQYVTEMRFGVRSAEIRANDGSPIFGGMASASQIGLDSYVVVQYIESRELVDQLEARLKLRSMFSRPEIDELSRLPADASIERIVEYWRGMVDSFFDITNGSVVVRVRAFTPADSFNLASEIRTSSEKLVNDITAHLRRDTIASAEEELKRAENRLKAALRAKEEFRSRERLVDPKKTAESTIQVAGKLREELAKAQAEIGMYRGNLSESSPVISALKTKIAGLERAIKSVDTETAQVPTADATLSSAMSSYEEISAEQIVAEKALSSAIESLERARATAGRQGTYLATFVRPSMPEQPLYPRRSRTVLVTLVCAFALWAIGWLMTAAVRDHLQ